MPAPLLRSLVDLIYPARCRLCEVGIVGDCSDFCSVCWEGITKEQNEPYCPTCGSSTGPFEVAQDRCHECRDGRSPILGIARVGPYRGALGQLLRGYKFHRRDDLEPFFAQALIEAARKRPWLERVEAVVPVPTHWRRRLRRPSYPAESLARQLSTATNRPLLNLLKRIRAGPHQVGLSLTARLANVRGAFALRNGVALKNSRLLLIDDVRTSGATLEECARVLKRGGAAEVYGAILVRAGDTGLGSPILTSI